MKSETKFESKYKFLGCELDVTESKCRIEITPNEDSCKDTLSLGTITKVLLKNDGLKQVAGKFAPFEVFQMEICRLDTCKGNVEFETKAKETFDIIKGKIEVRKYTVVDLVNLLITIFMYRATNTTLKL